jgi:hypothetical protein
MIKKNSLFWVNSENNIITNKRSFLKLCNYTNLKYNINSVFENIDWTKEPVKNLKQLYKERAEQLRTDYDYLIVYFSGGSDSITVVNSFLDNNIPIDEIVINSFSQVNKDVLNCDYAKTYLKFRSFRGKITINDLNLDKINTIIDKQLWFYSEDNFSGLLPSLSRRKICFFEQNNLSPYTIRNGKVAHIFGAEFPKIRCYKDSFYCNINHSSFINNFGYHEDSIFFFIPIEHPEVFVKQCHVLARYMYKTGLFNESDCKISIRDEFNPVMSSVKTGGRSKNQFLVGTESRMILETYISNSRFKDLYKNALYDELLKPQINKAELIYGFRSFKLFDVD